MNSASNLKLSAPPTSNPMPYANMKSSKENIVIILLILLGVIIVPVLFIWSADNLFALTLKTFIAAFFLLLLVRAVPRKEGESNDGKTRGEN